MDRLVAAGASWPGAAALSGGGDSLCLMHLLADWAAKRKLPAPIVLTVDHGLRPGSDKDARKAVALARKRGLKAQLLTRKGKIPNGDIEAAAREARYTLMGNWLAKNKIAALYVGHSRDDQAETFLLRLARGSGLDGLCAMRETAPWPIEGFAALTVVRPMLGLTRSDLRAHLKARGHIWAEDPMNADPRFARARIRKLLPALEDAGLSAGRIASAAAHLARARAALELASDAVLAGVAAAEKGRVFVDAAALVAAPREIGLRVLARLLMGVSGRAYRPRFEALERLYDAIQTGKPAATLHGCALAPAPRRLQRFGPKTLVLVRESSRKKA